MTEAKTSVESNVGRIEYKNARGKKESVLFAVKPLIRSAVMMPEEAEAVHEAHVVPVLYKSICRAVDGYGQGQATPRTCQARLEDEKEIASHVTATKHQPKRVNP